MELAQNMIWDKREGEKIAISSKYQTWKFAQVLTLLLLVDHFLTHDCHLTAFLWPSLSCYQKLAGMKEKLMI
ncbi:CLUMA_CG010806, isoform A [Clunio marinus]|uniref:CLUMA_CG010806, isoform A n=1 Tax=Clunio marinus TaxID=568069 RepID=A0A1J1IG44_9DIPT|nr:CLUMA_CG010806, isoform A [Clunio marinus]